MDFSLLKLCQIKSPRYFLYPFVSLIVMFILGVSLWGLIGDKNTTDQNLLNLTSVKNENQLKMAEVKAIQKLSVQRMPTQEIQEIPKRFSANPAFKFFSYIQKYLKEGDPKDRVPASVK